MKKFRDKFKSKIKTIIYSIFFEKSIEYEMHKKDTYNQIIQWVSLNDKDPLKIICSDKLKVKEYIKQKLESDSFTPKTLKVADNISELIQLIESDSSHPKKYIIKANNDSGNILKVDTALPSLREMKRIENYRFKSYGQEKGEWFYSGIQYKCFSEELLGSNLSDYKIHCSIGEPRFIQVISDRGIGEPKEVVVDIDGNILDIHLDTNFKYTKNFEKPKNWDLMIEISRKLSADFQLVRVDLYNTDINCEDKRSIFVGELTFAPRTGRYKGEGQISAGKLIKGI